MRAVIAVQGLYLNMSLNKGLPIHNYVIILMAILTNINTFISCLCYVVYITLRKVLCPVDILLDDDMKPGCFRSRCP